MLNMDFGDFFNTFGEGYRALWKKEDFCKAVLCSIVKNEDVVGYIKGIKDGKHKRSNDSFKSYYRNSKRRFDKKMAIAMINVIDTDKFKKFLVKYTSECTSKAKLSKNFKNEIPDINEDNLFEKLTEKYIEILHYESNKPDKRCKNSIVQHPIANYETILSNIQSTENSQIEDFEGNDDTNNIKLLINKLNENISLLITIGRRIASRQLRNPWNNITDIHIYPSLESELNEAYDELSLLYDKIDDYNSDNYSEFLNKVLTLIAKITKDSFIQTKDSFMITSLKNYPIHDLLFLIQEYQQN